MNDEDFFRQVLGESKTPSPLEVLTTSKVNLTQYAKVIAQALTVYNVEVSPEQLIVLLSIIEAIGTVATVVFRTWFSHRGGV